MPGCIKAGVACPDYQVVAASNLACSYDRASMAGTMEAEFRLRAGAMVEGNPAAAHRAQLCAERAAAVSWVTLSGWHNWKRQSRRFPVEGLPAMIHVWMLP